MLKITAIVVVLCGLLLTPTFADQQVRDMHDQLMKTVVRVSTEGGTGSGTVIYCDDRDEAGKFETYVLTNYHVISDAINFEERWDSNSKSMKKIQELDRVEVEIFLYNNEGTAQGQNVFQADIIAYDEKGDIAILKLYTTRSITADARVAPLLPEGARLQVFQVVYNVGCSLAHEPIPTKGMITDTDDTIDNRRYVMTNADIIFGNSGGACFVQHNGVWHLAGIPARGRVAQGNMVTHMNWIVPIERIRDFIIKEELTFLLNRKVTPKKSKGVIL